MVLASSDIGAYHSLPLTASALSSSSLAPDFRYDEPDNARLLSAVLHGSQDSFTPGEISAAGLLGKIFLHLFQVYLEDHPHLHFNLDDHLLASLGKDHADQGLISALKRFPTPLVFQSNENMPRYLLSDGASQVLRHQLYNSLVLIITIDENPFFRSRDGLFTDPPLRGNPRFQVLRSTMEGFFYSQPGLDGGEQSIIEFLREPARIHPGSISQQLDYIRNNWSSLLGDDLLRELLTGIDRLEEENQPESFTPGTPQDPLGHSLASYQNDTEQVRFSEDLDWMPRVIMLAKNIYVWLDQLSRRYQQSIFQLDHIPEGEFARLSDWGITTLWLIGIWERSPASQQIKHLCGNPDAVPSAYSLFDYTIASALGGEQGYLSLQSMAEKHGIRLAADMVPNHMGIYSRWVLDHPDWFLSRDSSPFPGYSFQGPDLSRDSSVGIFLEDHYYDKSDAAVVFKRTDYKTNSDRYIYHGNDGTSMPWNDTAQLDFLNPEAREAVIQTILHVARKFPVIRFDAAMTLTKKHYQRLWFPDPGTGGAIPTRSEYGLSKSEFDDRMPEEFWREVVDRVSRDAPDTLLLAEAFWMMEGYFVRSLGMHRVYNSAFMHMMRDEDNAKYRDLIIKTLEYDPQILKRYVNFMNNPDEETAISQFGTNGKYFGTCLMMVALPGLPMFGHGQIEGFSEKYGMEYKRAYYDEIPDQNLIDRHQKEIFPLLHKRYLFAEVENFVLYDLEITPDNVYQDVFAFSNRYQNERVLVVYHNKWGDVSGDISRSPNINGDSTTLLDGLGYSLSDGEFLLFREHISDQEYIRPLEALSSHGLKVSLGAYEYQVFLDFKIVTDPDGSYKLLEKHLSGKGTHSLESVRTSLALQPLKDFFIMLYNSVLSEPDSSLDFEGCLKFIPQYFQVFPEIPDTFHEDLPVSAPEILTARIKQLAVYQKSLDEEVPGFRPLVALIGSFFAAGKITYLKPPIETFLTDLSAEIYHLSQNRDLDRLEIYRDLYLTLSLIRLLDNNPSDFAELASLCFQVPELKSYLDVNHYRDIDWFNEESFVILLSNLASIYLAYHARFDKLSNEADSFSKLISETASFLSYIRSRLNDTEFKVDRILEIISEFKINT